MHLKHLASLAVLTHSSTTWAATVKYDFNVGWVRASPDGFERSVIGINGKWPCPAIVANVGDTIEVVMKNDLGNQTTGLHFHGMNQANSNYMDGASMVNQCPVIPGESVTYKFKADAAGTYWYHSHNMGQYPDGLRGMLIVHDILDPYKGQYDEEVTLTISDWYHAQTIGLVQTMIQKNNTQVRPPLPDGMLVNDGQGANMNFQVGKTYRVRMVSYSALAAAMVQFGSHPMQVIMSDGSYVKKAQVEQLRIAPAQRYDVLITAKPTDKGQNFPFLISLDENRDYEVSPFWPYNYTGYLVTDKSLPTNSQVPISAWQPFDDSKLVDYHNEPALLPTTTWQLDFDFCTDANGFPRACFNNQTYVTQKVPTLYSAATLGNHNSNPKLYGDVLPFVVKYGDVVEIVVNNMDLAIHPFHLHGHQFQVVSRPLSNAGRYPGKSAPINFIPGKRDVVSVYPNSYAVLRFVATNPGVFLFHCHVEWHVELGLTATLIEAPEKLHNYHIPQDHLNACKAQNIPVSGNAVGNTKDVTDMTGANTAPSTSYYGATYPNPGALPASKKVRSIRRNMSGQSSSVKARESW